MKRILLIMMVLTVVFPAWAGGSQQSRRELEKHKEDLNIHYALNFTELADNELFPEPYNYMRLVNDSKFAKYGISVFEHSIYRHMDEEECENMAGLVVGDAANAIAKEVIYREGRLVYALLQMTPIGKTNRFIAFQRGLKEVKLVYMEGVATLEELKRIFAKNQ